MVDLKRINNYMVGATLGCDTRTVNVDASEDPIPGSRLLSPALANHCRWFLHFISPIDMTRYAHFAPFVSLQTPFMLDYIAN